MPKDKTPDPAEIEVPVESVGNVVNQPTGISVGNQAPNSEGKIIVGHRRLENAFQWVPEEAFEEVWVPLGWERAAINEDNVAYFPGPAEEE